MEAAVQNSFSDVFYRRLYYDFENNAEKSPIFRFLKEQDDIEYKKMVDGNEFEKSSTKKAAQFWLRFYYDEYKENENSPEAVIKYLVKMFSVVCGTKKRFLVSKEDCAFLLKNMKTYFDIIMEKSIMDKFRRPDECKKNDMINLMEQFEKSVMNPDALAELIEFVQDNIDECVDDIDRTYNRLMKSSICYDVQDYFYRLGFRGVSKGKEKVRNDELKIREDKTIRLIELCSDSNYFGGDSDNQHRENCLRLFKIIMERGLDSGIEKDEYLNLFIPLFVDDYTGTALCIVGKDYYRKFYEIHEELLDEYEKNNTPCNLAILRLSDVSFAYEMGATTGIGYLYKEPFENIFKLENITSGGADIGSIYQEYFERKYNEYRISIAHMKNTFKNINHLTRVPKDLAEFSEIFDTSEKRLDETEKILKDISSLIQEDAEESKLWGYSN